MASRQPALDSPVVRRRGDDARWWIGIIALQGPVIALLVWNALYGLIAAAALCLGVLLASAWRRATLLVLVVVPAEAFFIPAGGLRLKLYQLVVLAILPGFVAAVVNRSATLSVPLLPPLLALLGVSSLSLLYSIAPAETVRVVFLQAMLFVAFLLVGSALQDDELLSRALVVFAVVGAAVALLGVYQLAAYRLGLPTGITQTLGEGRPWKYLTRYGRPSGTFFEPDWFAAFTMQAALLSIPLSVAGPRAWRRLVSLAAVVSVVGLVVSGTRAAWLGFAVGLLCLFLFRSAARWRLVKFMLVVTLVLVAVLVVLAFGYPPYFDLIAMRASNMFNSQSHGIEGRLNTLQVVTDQVALHPWIGSGTGVLDFLVQGRTKAMGGRLGPNVFLTTWMEIGVAGVALLSWLFVSLLVRLGRAAARPSAIAWAAQGSFAAVVGLLVQSQFNNSFLLGFFWVQLGISAATIALCERERVEE